MGDRARPGRTRARGGGPPGKTFTQGVPAAEEIAVLDELWRVDDPCTAPVLEALTALPERKVAEASATSSRGAGRG